MSPAAEEQPDVAAVDLNPLIIVDGVPVAVDALVELGDLAQHVAPARTNNADGFRALLPDFMYFAVLPYFGADVAGAEMKAARA